MIRLARLKEREINDGKCIAFDACRHIQVCHIHMKIFSTKGSERQYAPVA